MELLSVTMNDGVMPRSEIEGKDNSSEDKSNYKVVLTGDMVYNSMRMWQGANGISPCDGIVSPAYTVLMPKIPISNGYFAALFKSPNLINEFRKNSQGMTSDTWNLKYPQIETIKVSIPALPEQERIADMLGTLEKRINAQAQLVDSLKKYKRGLVKLVFEQITMEAQQQLPLSEMCISISSGRTTVSDTNGSFPEKLQKLIDSGNIDYVAMDIKNCPEKYAETVAIPEFDIANGGASLYRDRFHMGNCYGRYVVACVWLKKVCGIKDISSATFIPNEAYPPLIKKLNECVNNMHF